MAENLLKEHDYSPGIFKQQRAFKSIQIQT